MNVSAFTAKWNFSADNQTYICTKVIIINLYNSVYVNLC